MENSNSLQIKWKLGIDGNDLSAWNAYLGVSFSKTQFFSRQTMAHYIEWACSRFQSLLIIVADHLEAHNYRVFRGMEFTQAEAHTLRIGRELQRAYGRAVPPSFRSRVRVTLASEILGQARCAALVEQVSSFAHESSKFQSDLRESVVGALGAKMAAADIDHSRPGDSTDVLTRYIIEEIGIILYISQIADPPYHVSIFPYRPQPVICKVYAGEYGSHFLPITHGDPFRAMEVAPEFGLG